MNIKFGISDPKLVKKYITEHAIFGGPVLKEASKKSGKAEQESAIL